MARRTTRYLISLAYLAIASSLVRDHSGLDLSAEEPLADHGSQPRTHLVSFRSCSQDRAKRCNRRFFEQLQNLSRLAREIPSIEFHHLFQGYPPELLKDPRWARFEVEGVKGRGFWFWKPAILNLLLKKGTLRDGDVVVWADADTQGYFLSKWHRPEEGWRAWLAQNELDFFVQSQSWCEAQWTKGDVWERFNVPWNDVRYGLTPQAYAQFFIFKVNERTRGLLQTWEELMTDFHLVSDQRSRSPNPPLFRKNRHDQSILSLLLKASTPEKASFLGDCVEYAKQNGQSLDKPYSRKLHPEFGIANFSVQVADFAQEQTKALQATDTEKLRLQRRESALGKAKRRLCVQGSCYDLDDLRGGRPKEVAEVEEPTVEVED